MLTVNSIGAKFQLYVMLLIVAILILSNLIIPGFIHSFVDRRETENIIRWGKNFESLLEPNFVYYNYMYLTSQVEEILKERPRDFIFLLDSREQEILHRGIDALPFDIQAVEPLEVSRQRTDTGVFKVLRIPVTSQSSQTVWGYILYGHSLYGQNALMRKIKIHYIYISILLLLISGVAIHLVTRKIIRPINKLKKGFEKFSGGDFAYRTEIDTGDEFAYLSRTFNEMGERFEFTLKKLEDTQRDLESQINERTRKLNDANKKLQAAMDELTDTQKKIIQSEKQKSLTAIVSGFAHEINNPLTGILGYIDLMELRNDLPPYVREKLKNIKLQAQRINTIISELNQLNPEADKNKLEINLSNLMEKLLKIIGERDQVKDIDFIIPQQDDSLIVHGNHFALWQVFEGILTNSIEAIIEKHQGKGTVSVKLGKSLDNRQAIIEVTDNGGGFVNIDKAFDPFYTTKDRARKKGIGLSIAYNIVKEHNGTIIISNGEGGAVVSVYLPLLEKGTN